MDDFEEYFVRVLTWEELLEFLKRSPLTPMERKRLLWRWAGMLGRELTREDYEKAGALWD